MQAAKELNRTTTYQGLAPTKTSRPDTNGGAVTVWVVSVVPMRVQVELVKISEASVRVTTPIFIAPSSRVYVEFAPGCIDEGEILYCNRTHDAYDLSIYFRPDPDRPLQARLRIAANETAVVSTCSRGENVTFGAQLVHISRARLMLATDRAFPTETFLRVEFGSAVVFGEVTCSLGAGANSRIGLAIERIIFRTGNHPSFRFVDLATKDSEEPWSKRFSVVQIRKWWVTSRYLIVRRAKFLLYDFLSVPTEPN